MEVKKLLPVKLRSLFAHANEHTCKKKLLALVLPSRLEMEKPALSV